jgi:hypothetical protein
VGPQPNHDGRRERQAGEQTERRHAEGQKEGVQETLALLLHFHRQQFEPVFPDGQQPARERFDVVASCPAKLAVDSSITGSIAVAGAPAGER